MPHSTFAKTTLLLAIGMLAAACSSSDDRSLVVLDVQLGSGAVAPESVHLSASSAGIEVHAADVPWAKATSGILEVGLFIPSGVAGPVSITAKGMSGGAKVLEGALAQPVSLKVGGSVGPFPLVLNPPFVPPPAYDAGVDGASAEAGTPDAAVSDGLALDVGADGSPSEAGIPEVGVADSAGQVDLAFADVVAQDSPLTVDVADATPAVPDGPLVLADGANPGEAGEAGHVPGWEPAQNIENDIINRSYYPVVAVEPVSENVYVAWSENVAVKVRRWNRTSGTWEKTMVPETRGSPQDVTIGADAKGNIILAWGQGDSSLEGVWASRTSDGLSWSPPVHVASRYCWNLRLAVARNGTARAVYTKQAADSSWPLYSAYYDGTSWTENATIVAPDTNNSDQDPNLVVDASGDGILIFDSQSTGVAAVTLTGQTFSAPTTMNPNYSTNYLGSRAIAVNRKGEGVFVWSEYPGANMGIFARTYNPASGWSSVSPSIVSASSIYSVAAAIDEQDNVTILFQQSISTGANVMGIHGTVSGTWGDVAVLETDNVAGNLLTEYAFPKLAIDASGNVLAVWRKDLSTSSTTTYGAYASRFSGGSWLPQFQLGQRTGLEVPEQSVSVADSGFGAASFYFRSETTTTDPEAYNAEVAFFR